MSEPARKPADRGALALFAGRRRAFSWNTRVAIRRAAEMLGLQPGDEVLAPAWNCGSELDPLLAAGLAVRLYPADGQGVVDPDDLARLIGARTRAVYVIHYFGVLQPHLAAIRALCDARGLRLIEDCALSLFSGAAPVEGRAGDVAFFCFYKFLPVLGGGALVVNAPDLPDPAPFARAAPWRAEVKHLARRALGPVLALRRRGAAEGEEAPSGALPDMPGHYYFDPDLAERGQSRLTTRALAAVDVAAEIAARRGGHARLQAALAGLPGATPLFPQLPPDAVPLGLPLLVAPDRRGALVRALQAQGIAATPWWAGYHRGLDFAGQDTARGLKDGVLFLPLGAGVTGASLDRATATLRGLLR